MGDRMTPLRSEFEKFITEVKKFIKHAEQHTEFLGQQLRQTQIELYALKKELGRENDTTKD